MSISKEEIQQKFHRANAKRRDIQQIPKSIQQYLQFMDYKISKQIKTFTLLSLCGADRAHFIVDAGFQRAFATLTLNQKTQYYAKYIDHVLKICNRIRNRQSKKSIALTDLEEQQSRQTNWSIPLRIGQGFKGFQQTQIQINDHKVRSKGKNLFNIDLRNYILRKSKKKNQSCFVLEAIKQIDPETIRFAFLSEEQENKYLPIIIKDIDDACYETIQKQIGNPDKKRTQLSIQIPSKQIKLKSDFNTEPQTNIFKQNKQPRQSQKLLAVSRNSHLNRSVIQQMVKSKDEQQLDEQLAEIIDKQNEELEQLQLEKKSSLRTPEFRYNRNIFKIILPNYNLKELCSLNHFGSIYQSKFSQLYIYQSVKDSSQYKMQLTIQLPLNIVCKSICNVQLYKLWHPQIGEGQVKLKISSENSCILYLKTKAYSEWYRERDYLLLTHMFRMNNSYYIISKSVENSNFIPFQSIIRGYVNYAVWKIQPQVSIKNGKQKQVCRIFMNMNADHKGNLNKSHKKQLTLRFLSGFQYMQNYYRKQENQKKLTDVLGFEWSITGDSLQDTNNIQQGFRRNNSLRTCDFENGSQISNQDVQIFYSIEDLSEEEKQPHEDQQQEQSEHEVEPNKNQQNFMLNSQLIGNKDQEQQIKLNEQGLVILPKKYLKKKHITKPFDCEKKLMKFSYDNIVQKDHWVLEKGGGLKLINQVKIAAQNNVLKFIMGTLKKNLFSGKGILNISLPVQIFNIDSNLQRLCMALSLGPQFLQKVAQSSDKLERFKRVLAFGLSNSIIYFDVQKPFNPILGETYQGYIRGCPVYAEQISHHPPISTIYFIGRGYKVTGNLEAKVHVHMNSGDGINQGFYHVIFDDGQQIIFQTPPAQISGLAVGDRRFNVRGKGYYLDEQNGYYCEMIMQNTGGLFGKNKREFVDQIQGQIVKVSNQFIRKFINAPAQKKPSPSKGDIKQKLGQLGGRWPVYFQIDKQKYYDIRQDIPDKMIDDIYPLNSNSNYREDLLYRKKNDLSRSQIQKQRLQVLQRVDRKFRQKFHGKQH